MDCSDNDIATDVDFGLTKKAIKSGLIYSVAASARRDETSIEDDIIDASSPSPHRGGETAKHGGSIIIAELCARHLKLQTS